MGTIVSDKPILQTKSWKIKNHQKEWFRKGFKHIWDHLEGAYYEEDGIHHQQSQLYLVASSKHAVEAHITMVNMGFKHKN